MSLRSEGTLRAGLAGLVAVAALLLAGCSSGTAGSSGSSSTTGTVPPVASTSELVAPQGFRAVTVVVTLPDGRTREWCMWLADTAELRGQGLMGVTDPGLGGGVGMVFSFPEDTSSGFWMKDTPMPLSIAWYPVDEPMVASTDMEPCPAGTDACPSYSPGRPYRYAVEVPAGTLDGFGLVEGSRLALGAACEPGDQAA